jgi:hypothetical protein
VRNGHRRRGTGGWDAILLLRLYDAGTGAPGVEKALQDQHGGDLVDHLAVSGGGASGGVQVAMGFGGAEALIPEMDGEGEGAAEGFGEGLGADRLRADVSGKMEGVAENDLRAAKFAEQAAERLQVLLLIPANKGQHRLRGEAEFIGDGNANAAGAKIEAEQAGLHTLS